MPNKKRIIKTIKEKIKVFKKDEQGADVLITLLMIAFALVLLALLLLYAVDTFTEVRAKSEDLISFDIIISTFDILLYFIT